MKRLPTLVSFLLFLTLAASFAYWTSQWTAPLPRAVSSPPKSERTQAPLSAAANLFGGRSQGTTMANVQLRGIVHAARSSDSVAIIAVEGKPTRALVVNSEIAPGVKVTQILDKKVVVTEQGAERELSLPAFATQESTATAQSAAMPSANAPGVVSPSPTSSGVSGTQGSGMVSPAERSKIPAQTLPVSSATGSTGATPNP